tara:strand:+ start:184 stop:327 length:144 start_codon:yes stop_codon:yes gene_type:complete
MNKFLKIWKSFPTVAKVANVTSALAGLSSLMVIYVGGFDWIPLFLRF